MRNEFAKKTENLSKLLELWKFEEFAWFHRRNRFAKRLTAIFRIHEIGLKKLIFWAGWLSFETFNYFKFFQRRNRFAKKNKFSNHAVFELWTIELFQVISKRVSVSKFEFLSKLWKLGTLKHFKSFHRRIRFVKGLRILGMLFELWNFEVYIIPSYTERIAKFSTFYSKLIKI